MKQILILFAFSLIFFTAKAQVPVDSETGLITYQNVVSEDGIPDTLYSRGISWINTYFKNPANVFRVKDTETHKIAGRYRIRMVDTDEEGVKTNSKTVVEYAFTIECKENRYRYTMDDFSMKASSKYPLERWLNKEDPTYLPKYEDYLSQVNFFIENFVNDLMTGMKKKEEKTDDW